MLNLTNTRILQLFCISILIITFTYTENIIASSEATPKTYYIATNGNDNNPGTIAKPWHTINYAANNSIVKPGDTILIREGTYNESVKQSISGSENALITYKNYPSETVIIGDKGETTTYRWLILDHSYVKIEGINFNNNQNGAIEIRTKYDNVSNVHLINNRIINQGGGSGEQSKTIHITTLETKRTLKNIFVIGNYFENINNGERPTLHLTGQVQDTLVQNNTFKDTSFIALGLSGQPTMGQPQNIIIKDNHISGHGWLGGPHAGIYLNGAGNNILIEGNNVHDGTQGIKVNHEPVNKTLTSSNIIIRRNVIFDNYINLKMGSGASSDDCQETGSLQNSVSVHNTIALTKDGVNHWFSCGTNLKWKNNLFVNTSGNNGYHYILSNLSVDTSTWTLNNNFFYDTNLKAPFNWFNKDYPSLNDFVSASGFETNAKFGIPEFEDLANHNYELTANSNARNAGAPLTTTENAGNGTSIEVYDASYFSDGFGLQTGDKILVGQEEVIVTDVLYDSHILKVNKAISWNENTPVSYNYAESNPDSGAYEYTPTINFTAIPKDGQIDLFWKSSVIFPENTNWEIAFQPKNSQLANVQTVTLPLNTYSYSLTNIPNYELYTITISASLNGETLISKTIESFATDMFDYLPIVNK